MNNRELENFFDALAPYWPAAAFLAGLSVLWITLRAIRHDELPSLILKEFYASTRTDRGYHVVISGRPKGILAFLLWLFGLGTKIRFEVTDDSVGFQISNWHRHIRDSLPISNVASTSYGYSKQTGYLVLGILAQLAAIAGGLMTFLAANQQARIDGGGGPAGVLGCTSVAACFLGLFAFLLYRSSARLEVAIETNGGRLIGVRFKRGFFGSPAVDLRDASNVIDIINLLVRKQY